MSAIRPYQPRVVGNEDPRNPAPIQRLIKANMDCIEMEEGRDADFRLGFGGLRRTEMIRLARKHDLALDENLPGEEMKARMEQFFLEGRFTIPNEEDQASAALERALERMSPDKLAALLERRTAGNVAEHVEQVETAAEPSAIGDVDLDHADWTDLQKMAKERGLYERGDNRDTVIAKLRAQ